MTRANHQQKRTGGRLATALVLVIGLAAAFGTTGCDEYADYGYGDDYGYYGYGPIDDDVFDAAADGWTDYIRM